MKHEPWELRLVVSRREEGLEACWIIPGDQESESFELNLPVDADAAASLRWYFEDYLYFPGVGDRAHAEIVESRLETWGRELYEALFTGRIGGRLEERIEQLGNASRETILTLGSGDPEFHAQPWELMRGRSGPAVFRGVTIRRQSIGMRSTNLQPFAPPLRALLIVSRPDDAGFIDPRNSMRPLIEALERLPSGAVDLQFCEPPTFERLEEMISKARKNQRPFHLVHFDGHGQYLPETGVGALAFEADEEGRKADLIPGRKFGDLLSQIEIPFVLLEACRSSALSDRPIHTSVAPALLDAGVGSVVAFSHSVHIEAARILVERLYRELVDGLTVSRALNEARKAMFANSRRWIEPGPEGRTIELQDWGIVQLYQVGADPVLIAPELSLSGTTDTQTNVRGRRDQDACLVGDFPPEPMYEFHGRAADLLMLERLFRNSSAVLISGMGGMGKTALSREASSWWLRTERFEAAIFHSFETKTGVVEIVRSLGRAFEGDDFLRLPKEEQRRRAVELFQSRRLLLIWDNFESTLSIFQKGDLERFDDEERAELRRLFEDLTEGSPQSRILVTCRPEATGLPESRLAELALRGLWRTDSLGLLTTILKMCGISTAGNGWERENLHQLLDVLGDHPLSISLVAPHLGERTPVEIREDLKGDLHRFTNEEAAEHRNSSLLASLEFSKRRLSEAARRALPYLACFEIGVVEGVFLGFSEITMEEWIRIRQELEETALLRVEQASWSSSPILRFHPTLVFAASGREFDQQVVGERFFDVYIQVRRGIDQVLHGSDPGSGMQLLRLEEANIRKALDWATVHRNRQSWLLADLLIEYLKRTGRVREREKLAKWFQEQLSEIDVLDQAGCAAVRAYAHTQYGRGDSAGAIDSLKQLTVRLEAEDSEGFQLATTYRSLSEIYVGIGRPRLAVSAAERAVIILREMSGDGVLTNLAAALGDHANALRQLGRFAEALVSAEEGVEINRRRNDRRSVVVGLGQTARILTAQRQWESADARYQEAFEAALEAKDFELQAVVLQHRAGLHQECGRPDRAAVFGKEALILFQQAENLGGEMRTCDLLGSAERDQGHFEAAESWYARSRELAEIRRDGFHLAVLAQNVALLHRRQAEQAEGAERDELLRRSMASAKRGLAWELENENHLGAAASYLQIGVLYRDLGDLKQADEQIRRCLQLYLPLRHPNVEGVYRLLVQMAEERGDEAALTQWTTQLDDWIGR